VNITLLFQFSATFAKFHGEEALQKLYKRGDNTEIKERMENFRWDKQYFCFVVRKKYFVI
jgi:hypothetical protein